MWLYSQTWYPKWYPKKFFENCKFGAFQRRVSHVYSHPRSKVTYLSIFIIFWYSIEFAKISLFRLKLSKNLQSLQRCKNTHRLHNDTCDTAFESLDVIFFSTWNFWYHNGTQKPIYVRHIKLGWFERVILNYLELHYERSASSSSFRKYLAPRWYFSFLTK